MLNPIKLGKNLLDAKRQYDKLQERMRKIQVTGESKGSLVKATINGLKEVVSVSIDERLLGDKADLERHVRDAVNEAGKKLNKQASSLMSKDEAMNMLKGLMG